jgi:aspartyl-tRNA(Asn)/glutamyl-tRNA(Gln) amidotransferase subunit C
MSTIDRELVKHLGELARISLSEKELDVLTVNLATVLDYVEDLKKVNTDGLPEVSQVTGLKNVLRIDEALPVDMDADARIKKSLSDTEDGYLKVKAVFDN